MRLFWQIFLATLLILCTSILAMTWFGTNSIQSFYYQQMEKDIINRAFLLQPHIKELLQRNQEQLQKFCRETGRTATTRITVIAHDGAVQADSNEKPEHMDNHGSRPEIKTALGGAVGSSLRFSKTLGQQMLYVAIPVDSDQAATYVLRLSVPAVALNTVLNTIYKRTGLATLSIALISALLSYFLARRISAPLEKMRRGAAQLAAGKTDSPIVVQDPQVSKEMTELAQAFNEMAQQVNNRIKIIIQQRNELEAVFSSMTDGVLAIGTDQAIIRMNKAAAELFHINGKAVEGEPYEGVLRNMRLQQFVRSSLDKETIASEDLTIQEPVDQMTLRIHAVPLYDGEGKKMGSLIILNNLTRLNQLENIRQDFVANVSHELKTPITAIRGYVETLLDGALTNPEESKEFLQIIERQSDRLDAIVDDLLTLARIEDRAEKIEKQMVREQICPLLEGALQTCQVQAQQKNIRLDLSCDRGLEGIVNRSMLEQAIINLMTNAITYSPQNSSVKITAEEEPTSSGQSSLRISVQDQGSGIASEQQGRIFERFYRCDKARSREHGGTGLGLAIVKHIAQAHNGTVDVQSRLGKGSTFILTLSGEDTTARDRV